MNTTQIMATVACLVGMISKLSADVALNEVWQTLYSATGLVATEDEDQDRDTNLMECIAGTDPLNPADRFTISQTMICEEGILVRWQAVRGRNYIIERRDAPEAEWTPVHSEISSSGGQKEVILPAFSSNPGELRLKIKPETVAELAALDSLSSQDADADGQSDVVEYLAGTHPFDPASKFEISDARTGPFIELEWMAHEGKSYQIQCAGDLSSGSWTEVGEKREGISGQMNAAFTLADVPGKFFRIAVSDSPTAIPGLSEWAAHTLGLTPLQRNEYERSGLTAEQILDMPVKIDVETPEPVANISRNGIGQVKIRRTQGFQQIVINYTIGGTAVAGTDYEALSGQMVLPMGQSSAILDITPLPGYNEAGTKSITLNFQLPDEAGTGFTSKEVTVNLFKEARLSVADYGATGDGTTDDTASIQSAIIALESSPSYNTLWFPQGTYCLKGITYQTYTSASSYRTLAMGFTAMTGRDIVIAGAPGSILFSKTGAIRSHMLLTRATWRTLSIHDLTFQKDSTPLGDPMGREPSGAYGVAVVEKDDRVIEKLAFIGCTFTNCHGATRTYGSGANLWGKLRQFRMEDCQVLNPYGSNSINSLNAIGGGQQVVLSPWIDHAVYRNDLFVGGPDIVTDFTLNPAGVPKDGSHFGSPLRLEFEDNVVRNMGIEAIFPTTDSSVGNSNATFLIPPEGSNETVSVAVVPTNTVFEIGQIINFRQFINGNTIDCILTIRGIDPTGKILELSNDGLSMQPISGFTINQYTQIYAQFRQPTEASIRNNIITSTGDGNTTGIASNAHAFISGNFIQNKGIGIRFETKIRDVLGDPGRYSTATDNIISLISSPPTTYRHYGIHSAARDAKIEKNFIQSEITIKSYGLLSAADKNQFINNFISVRTPSYSGYASPQRGVGIGVFNTATNTIVSGNSTRGFDVGVGSSEPNQNSPFLFIDHHSYFDVLPIDSGAIYQ